MSNELNLKIPVPDKKVTALVIGGCLIGLLYYRHLLLQNEMKNTNKKLSYLQTVMYNNLSNEEEYEQQQPQPPEQQQSRVTLTPNSQRFGNGGDSHNNATQASLFGNHDQNEITPWTEKVELDDDQKQRIDQIKNSNTKNTTTQYQ